MPKAYLTIDDGPSDKFESLVDFLSERQIPAVFFNRGDAMEANPDAVRYGIKKGYIMANHGYAHKRASQMSLREIQDDIVRAEKVLENIYWSCGEDRDGYYFRFPYMDRGMGPCFAEDINEEYAAAHVHLLSEGLGHVPAAPSKTMIEHKNKLQEFLRFMEFDALPVEGVTLPWFVKTQMGAAMDSLCTFSTSDWALSARHKGRRGFDSFDDLKRKIDRDPWLHDESSHHVILVHDQEEIHDITTGLIDYFCEIGFEFLDFGKNT